MVCVEQETREVRIDKEIFICHCLQEELEVMRAKLDRLEQERNHLKHDNDRLEAKVSVRNKVSIPLIGGLGVNFI
jgi:FtsZ-binding cell division protein ZapB